MPDLGALFGGIVSFIGEQVAASSLRLGPLATVTLLLGRMAETRPSRTSTVW